MRSLLKRVKVYLIITFTLSILFVIGLGVYNIINHTLPLINMLFIFKVIGYTLYLSVISVPVIGIIDLIFYAAKSLVVDYIVADRRGRTIIIIAVILVLLRKILMWTR